MAGLGHWEWNGDGEVCRIYPENVVTPWRAMSEFEKTLVAEVERLNANLAAIRCEIDARRECADMTTVRAYAAENADMRPRIGRDGS